MKLNFDMERTYKALLGNKFEKVIFIPLFNETIALLQLQFHVCFTAKFNVLMSLNAVNIV